MSLGDKIADKVARFGSSWTFIILFSCFVFLWILLNSIQFIWKPFDPYPFILLNLFFSYLASIQAPIIMMSQRRAEERDRERGIEDLEVDKDTSMRIQQVQSKLEKMELYLKQLLKGKDKKI